MTAFQSRWLEWSPPADSPKITLETPTQRTDKTDKSPSVSFVSASPRCSEGDFHANDAANRHKPRPALSPVPLTALYPVPPGDEWLADGWYALRQNPDDFEERAAILEYCGEMPREEAERLARQV